MLAGAWGSSPRSAGRVLRLWGRLLAGLRRALPASEPASDPARYPVFVGDRNCPERHGLRVAVPSTWKRRRLLLCVSPRLLAPAACRVPGGLIKFDLFFASKYITPTSAGRAASLLSSTALGSLGLPLRVCPAACKAGDAEWGGVPQLQGCRGRASQAPATLLWPRIYPQSSARAPSLSHPWSRGLSRRKRNVLIF